MKYIVYSLVLIYSGFICSCQKKYDEKQIIITDGFWEQMGYGKIIHIKDSTIQVYHKTSQYCIEGESEALLDFGRIEKVTKDTLFISHGIDLWKFKRLDTLPNNCYRTPDIIDHDPRYNFEVFWQTFKEQYASFALKNLDWDAVYKKFSPRVTDTTSDLELYQIFEEMIALFKDGHVTMEIPESIEDLYTSKKSSDNRKYSKLDEFELTHKIAEEYLDSVNIYNAGMVRYGRIESDIGYIQINSMLMLANYPIPETSDLRSFFNPYWEYAETQRDEIQRSQEVEGINQLLGDIFASLGKVKAYILDLRFNGGGKDGVALAILNHFTTTNQIIFTKKAKTKNGFASFQKIRAIPEKEAFNGPVYLLTSHLTASASEVLVLGSLALPNFKRIGSTTEGIFSSTLDKTLPIGWEYELSNEVYEDGKGNNYENQGITPDYNVSYPKNKDEFFDLLIEDLAKDKDQAIEKALELISD